MQKEEKIKINYKPATEKKFCCTLTEGKKKFEPQLYMTPLFFPFDPGPVSTLCKKIQLFSSIDPYCSDFM